MLGTRAARPALLALLVASAAVALAPPANAAADPCDAVTPDLCGAVLECERLWEDGPGVVGQTLFYVSREVVVVCEVTHAQVTVVWFVTLASCSATLDYVAGGHCDGSSFGPYQPGPVRCRAPGPAGPGLVGATVHYAEVEAYIACLAASMETGVLVGAAVETCNATWYYLMGEEPLCLVSS